MGRTIVAGVSQTILIGVHLIRIIQIWADVTCIGMAVIVAV